MTDKTSIRRKLVLLTALLVGSMGLLATLYAGWLSYQNASIAMRDNAVELAQLLQHSLREPLRLADDYQTYELISAPFEQTRSTASQSHSAPDAQGHTHQLEHIALLDDAGIILSSSHPRIIPLGADYNRTEPGLNEQLKHLKSLAAEAPPRIIELSPESEFLVLIPVSENGVKYANLVLDYQEKNLLENVFTQFRQSALMIALFTLPMLLLARLASLRLVEPLHRLADDMFQFARRQGLSIEHADIKSQDEVTQLKEIFSDLDRKLSDLMEIAAKRDEEQRAYLQTLNLLQDAVIELAPDGMLIRATDAWQDMTGTDSFVRCDMVDCVHPDDADEVQEEISVLARQQKQQVHFRFRLHRRGDTDSHNWVEARFTSIMQGDQVASIRGVLRDINNTYLQERQISHMALHDALTGLPNRVLLDDRVEVAIARAERENVHVALGFIDLDHFKQVNDNFGHKTGDRLLKEVTHRFSQTLRHTDTLARWGGDEFVVLCPDLDSLEDAVDITRKLTLLTHDNISIDGTEFPFTFSAGFAIFPDDADNAEMLMAQADRAMFYAKAQGRNNIQFFHNISGKEPGRQSFYIQSRLATAIHGDNIQAWLQPLISARTGKVIGAEVLARWHEEDLGWVSPAVFIPMAESLGLIDKLGQSVWLQALRSFPQLPEGHRLSINLSKRQLFSSTIVQQFCDDIEQAGIRPGQIMLEITEGIALSEVEFARERIAELDAKGFGIAVDDFGTGYSSLSQLHEIPADELKLDISFVRRIHEKSGLGIASAIIAIARSLNLECVAEGVEDEKTASLLRNLGVEVLQGYHFAKPMPIGDYVNWLSSRNVKLD